MTDPDIDALERIETMLEKFPEDVVLDAARLPEFRRRRARIHQRYNEWRRGMPTLEELFDGDEHRAKALAGSLATELERVFELYGEMSEATSTPAEGHRATWPAAWAADWRKVTVGMVDAWGWDADAARIFEAFLDDLTASATRRAVAGERPRSARPEISVSRSRRLAIMAFRRVRRFFKPV